MKTSKVHKIKFDELEKSFYSLFFVKPAFFIGNVMQ